MLELDQLTDEEVASAATVSSHAAFDVLFARYKGPVFSFIARQIFDPSRVEDLFQNTFLKAFRALATFRRDSKFKTWLFTIASNVIVDEQRRGGRSGGEAGLSESMAATTEDQGRALDHEDTVAMLRKALDELSPEHRQLFLLVRFHDMKIAEAAVAVGLSPASAKVTLFRIQQKLGQTLGTRLKTGAP